MTLIRHHAKAWCYSILYIGVSPLLRHHCGLRSDPVLEHNHLYDDFFDGWSDLLDEMPRLEDIERLRRRTYAGVPCGDEEFVDRMSKRVGRNLIERPRGRPGKSGLNAQH
jgi:hypothetical protein